LALLLTLAESLPGPAAAPLQARDTRTWYQAYSDGQRAVQERRWQAAIDSLEFARRVGPKPGRRVPSYGDRFEDFLPDYYLGIAYLNAQRFADAERAFEAVRASGLIGARDREFATFEASRKTAQFESLLAGAQRALDEKKYDEALRIAAAASSLGVDASRSDGLTTRIRSAKQTADAAVAANAPASSAPAPTAVSPPPGSATAAPSQPSVTPPQVAPPTYAPPATSVAGSPRLGSPAGLRPGVTPGIGSGSTAIFRREEPAMRAFLSGQYSDASQRLTALSSTASASPRVYFYLACAEAARVLTGEAPAGSIANAKALLARAGDVNQFSADRRYISPRILKVLGVSP
jgi:hypothetical protein